MRLTVEIPPEMEKFVLRWKKFARAKGIKPSVYKGLNRIAGGDPGRTHFLYLGRGGIRKEWITRVDILCPKEEYLQRMDVTFENPHLGTRYGELAARTAAGEG